MGADRISLLCMSSLLAGACGGAAAEQTQVTEPQAHHGEHAHRHHSFADVERYAAAFEAPERAEWQRPEEVADALGLEEGQRVADIGAGTGYFAARFAARVGATGRVYAVDIEPNMIAYLRQRAEREGLANLVAVESGPQDPRLPEAVDRVFVCNTWHHIDDRRAYLRALRPLLREGAQLAIVDFHKQMEIPVPAPPPSIRLRAEEVIAEFEAEGFTLLSRPELLPYQYILIFGSGASQE